MSIPRDIVTPRKKQGYCQKKQGVPILWAFGDACSEDSPQCALAIAKLPAEAGTGAIVAAGEGRWRLIIPVSVEGDVPGQIPPQLNVVRGVEIEVHTAGLRNGGKENRAYRNIGFVEPQKLDLPPHHPGTATLRQLTANTLPSIFSLPA